jgi:hypothetical protein
MSFLLDRYPGRGSRTDGCPTVGTKDGKKCVEQAQMSMTYVLDAECRLVRIKVHENVPPADLVEFYDRILAEKEFRPENFILKPGSIAG